jgi:PAS domain-containing protein
MSNPMRTPNIDLYDPPMAQEDPAPSDLQQIRKANADLMRENDRLHREIARLQERYDDLAARHETLLAEQEAARKRMKQKEANLNTGYELFKSFVDRDDQEVVLIDAAYTIRYVNRSAASALRLPDPYIIVGRRIFDFFAYKDALKLKDKIDKAFLNGEKEKIKGVAFQNLKGAFFELKIKMTRVRYQDKPSIKLVLK